MRFQVRFLPLLFACLAALVFAGCVNVAGGGMGVSLVTFLVLALGMGIVACSDDSTTSGDAGWQVEDDIASEDADSSEDTEQPSDAQQPSDTVQPEDIGANADAEADVDGRWESCCEDGVVSSCFCPADMVCNYGMYERCGNGTCTYGGQACPSIDAGFDATEEDISEELDSGEDADTEEPGSWESCCNDGVVDSCFCPAQMACNYGMYNDCGDGICVPIGQECTPGEDL